MGVSDNPTIYDKLNRAIHILRNKACASNVTWDPSLIYCNIATTSPTSYIVTLPYQVQKPIAVNLNTNPSFSRGQLFEFTMNGPGSADPLLGWQWMDQGTKPLQVPLPFSGTSPTSPGNVLLFTSDNPGDVGVVFTALVTNLDNSESTISITLGVPTAPVQDLLAVNKPVTLGNITVSVSGNKVAVYAPNVTNPNFSQIKISQLGASVRILGRRRYIDVANLTDFIPLESKEAVIQMVKAVKYYDEDQFAAATQCEQIALTWLNEDNASRMLFSANAAATQISPALNINIYNRDSVIAADVYEQAVAIFGNIGLQNIFDQITIVVETLQNMSQWDPLVGYVDIQSFGSPDGNQFYVTLPRYVEEVLAMNINGHPAKFQNKWFEFNMNGLYQDNFDGRYPAISGIAPLGLWSNRPLFSFEDIGEFVLAFDPLPVNTAFNVVAIATNPLDAGSNFRIFGTDTNQLPIYDSDGSKGFLVPVGTGSTVFPPNPAGANLLRVERIFRDATSGFVNLWSCDALGNLIQLLGTYGPDETEPKYRRIRLGQRPLTSATGSPQYPVMRMRYRKRWTKITSLTDPLHLRSRKAIIEGMKAVGLGALQTATMAPGQGLTMERAAFEVALKYLNDEWRALHQREGLDIQVDTDLWPGVGAHGNFDLI